MAFLYLLEIANFIVLYPVRCQSILQLLRGSASSQIKDPENEASFSGSFAHPVQVPEDEI